MANLKEYPVSVPPTTWGLNDVYLNVLDRQIKRWADAGYRWLFSAECEFTPSTPEDFLDLLASERIDRSEIRSMFIHYTVPLELLERLEENPVDRKAVALQALQEVRQTLENIAENPKLQAAFEAPEVTVTSEELLMDQLPEFEAQLHSDNPQQVVLGVQNAYLAYLNVMPRDRGGLLDTIQPRYGDSGYGMGWWDGEGVAEVRPKISNPTEFIHAYHEAIEITRATGLKFGLIADWRAFHLNWSVQRTHDGKNMLEVPVGDTERADFSERALSGIQALMMAATPLKADVSPFSSPATLLVMEAQSMKCDGLRMRPNGSWEYRLSYGRGFPHLARDLSFFIMGAAWGCLDTDDLSTLKEKYNLIHQTGRTPVVRPLHGQILSPIQAILETSTINEYGHIMPDLYMLRDDADLLREVIGEEVLPLFKGAPSIEGYDKMDVIHDLEIKNPDAYKNETPQGLETLCGLLALFQSLKIGPDNRFDTSHLAPELAAAFNGFAVTGYRTTLNSRLVATAQDIGSLSGKLVRLTETEPLPKYFTPDEIQKIRTETSKIYHDVFRQHGRFLCRGLERYLKQLDPDWHLVGARDFAYMATFDPALDIARMEKMDQRNLGGDYLRMGAKFPELFLAIHLHTRKGVIGVEGENSLVYSKRMLDDKQFIVAAPATVYGLRDALMKALDEKVATANETDSPINWPQVQRHIHHFLVNPANQIEMMRRKKFDPILAEMRHTDSSELRGMGFLMFMRDLSEALETVRGLAKLPDEHGQKKDPSKLSEAFTKAGRSFVTQLCATTRRGKGWDALLPLPKALADDGMQVQDVLKGIFSYYGGISGEGDMGVSLQIAHHPKKQGLIATGDNLSESSTEKVSTPLLPQPGGNG